MNRAVDEPRRVFHCLFFISLLLGGYFAVGAPLRLEAAQLHVGAATVDITPEEPVALDGQRLARISTKPATRIYATVLAVESRKEDEVLDQAALARLQSRAADMDLAALVEVHDEHELVRAIDAGARVVGVNNRNLRTLQVDIGASYRLAAKIPRDVSKRGHR